VLYHALQAGETTMQYIHDAEQAGDQELAAFFRQVLDSDRARAEQAKKLLQRRLAQYEVSSWEPATAPADHLGVAMEVRRSITNEY
jgi:hypothetical protein